MRTSYSDWFDFCFSQTHFVMFWLGTFSTINKTLSFCFPFDFLDWVMSLLLIFYRDSGMSWQRKTRAAPGEFNNWFFFFKLHDNLLQSEMTNFLENRVLKKSHSRAYDDGNIENEDLIRTSPWVYWHCCTLLKTKLTNPRRSDWNDSCWSRD